MRRFLFAVVVLIAAFTPTSHIFAAAPRSHELAIPLQKYVGNLLLAEVEIEGIPARLLFDTGGGMTLISSRLAEAVGCQPHGRWVGFRMTGERLQFRKCGAVQLQIGKYQRNVSPGVFDLMQLLPEGLPPVDGVLSLDSFDGERITIDLAHKTLTIAPAMLPAGATPGEVRIMRDMAGAGLSVFAVAKAKTGSLRFLIDSANLDRLVLSPGAAEQLELGPKKKDELVTFSLQLIGLPPQSVEARVSDIIYDGALNFDTLRAHPVTIDLEQSNIWFHPKIAE